MVDSTAACDWGVRGQADQGRRAQPLVVAKGKPEDVEMRGATHVIQACGVVESII